MRGKLFGLVTILKIEDRAFGTISMCFKCDRMHVL